LKHKLTGDIVLKADFRYLSKNRVFSRNQLIIKKALTGISSEIHLPCYFFVSLIKGCKHYQLDYPALYVQDTKLYELKVIEPYS